MSSKYLSGDKAALQEFLNKFDDKKAVADNIEQQARYCDLLIIWTDCDREGENIGREIVGLAKKGKPTIRVKRAKFSNIERTYLGPTQVCTQSNTV
ncbi:DNA topoisomerase 3 like protein [Verticillium longisporum]|uniref:DNA topoisomerase n=1 Tax=Verticillium longisporum TaxID=100787 RepID=A0A8I2ZMA4_VERLO|nr:DNA topoisomerase 3 like protein [Verticillium longisporum]